MTLNPADIVALTEFLAPSDPKDGFANHGSLFMDGIANDPTAIAASLQAVPAPDIGRFSYPMANGKDNEYQNYVTAGFFLAWHGNYLEKILNRTAAEVLGKDFDDLERMAHQLLNDLTSVHLGDSSNSLISELTLFDVVGILYDQEEFLTLNCLLVLATSDGVFSEITAKRVLTEFGGLDGNTRWESIPVDLDSDPPVIGLSEAPLSTEISSILGA